MNEIKDKKSTKLPKGCIHHSDLGAQYTAKETVHWRHFQTREEVRQTIFAYIESFYNTRRVQKRLGYLSPIEWLNQYSEQFLVSVA